MLLAALDLHLTLQPRQQGEGAAGDGSISLEVLTQILQALPGGVSPGFDGLPYEFLSCVFALPCICAEQGILARGDCSVAGSSGQSADID